MKFYYRGKKAPSEGYDVASGCLLMIVFAAIFYAISLFDSMDDVKEYWMELVFLIVMSVITFLECYVKKENSTLTESILKIHI